MIEEARGYENHYPQMANLIMVINGKTPQITFLFNLKKKHVTQSCFILYVIVPRVFEVILELVRPLLTPHTQKAAHLYTYNKEEWKREILKVFPPENVTPEFGGTLKIGPS